MRRTLVALLPALLWAVIVLYIGGRSSVPSPGIDIPIDKVAHFTMYFILGLLAARAARRVWRRVGWGWFITVGLALGALDEFQHRFIPGRSADILDWVADAAGFIIGFWIVYRRVGVTDKGGRG
jgi:VanZ family protein